MSSEKIARKTSVKTYQLPEGHICRCLSASGSHVLILFLHQGSRESQIQNSNCICDRLKRVGTSNCYSNGHQNVAFKPDLT